MLRNFLAATLRNMARHRAFTAVILGGLAVAFAAAIVIALFVYDKFHAESFIPDAQRIYLVGTVLKITNQPEIDMALSAPEAAGLIRAAAPQIEDVTRLHQVGDTFVRRSEITGHEVVAWVDPNFFSVLRMPTLWGDPAQALRSPGTAVVTRQVAQKYFGTADPRGQLLELNRSQTVRIGAVLEDLPAGTSLAGQIYISTLTATSPLAQLEAERAKYPLDLAPTGLTYSYVMLKDPAALPEVERAVAASEQIRSKYPQAMRLSLLLVPLSELHLRMPGSPGTTMTVIIGLLLIGVLVLSVAGVNFVNLMTARASSRAKEICIRKVAGAGRHHLILQFIGEAIIYVAIALFLALSLVELSASFWSKLLLQPFSLTAHPELFAGILACALVFAILAGAYPAFVLSAFAPQSALKAAVVKSSGSKLIREILVGAQFALLVATLIGTMVISRQVKFATRDVLSFDTDQTLILTTSCPPAFADEVRKIPGVEAQFCSAAAPLQQFSFDTAGAITETGTPVSLSGLVVDLNFFDFYGIRPLAGRLLSEEFATDQISSTDSAGALPAAANASISVVINERAMWHLGYKKPEAAVGRVVKYLLPTAHDARIVGVVPDFVIGPVRASIRPVAFVVDPSRFSTMTIRLSKSAAPAATAAIEDLWRKQNPAQPFRPLQLKQIFESVYRDVILESVAFQSISLVALITTGLGLLGLSVFNVQSRTKEIGVRMAMGASRFAIVTILCSQFARPVLCGNLIAWPIAYIAARYWLQGFAYHMDLTAENFLVGSAFVLLITGGVVFLHAWQAASSEPSDLLRYE